jgi:hypothetical protein
MKLESARSTHDQYFEHAIIDIILQGWVLHQGFTLVSGAYVETTI